MLPLIEAPKEASHGEARFMRCNIRCATISILGAYSVRSTWRSDLILSGTGNDCNKTLTLFQLGCIKLYSTH